MSTKRFQAFPDLQWRVKHNTSPSFEGAYRNLFFRGGESEYTDRQTAEMFVAHDPEQFTLILPDDYAGKDVYRVKDKARVRATAAPLIGVITDLPCVDPCAPVGTVQDQPQIVDMDQTRKILIQDLAPEPIAVQSYPAPFQLKPMSLGSTDEVLSSDAQAPHGLAPEQPQDGSGAANEPAPAPEQAPAPIKASEPDLGQAQNRPALADPDQIRPAPIRRRPR